MTFCLAILIFYDLNYKLFFSAYNIQYTIYLCIELAKDEIGNLWLNKLDKIEMNKTNNKINDKKETEIFTVLLNCNLN